MNLLSAYRLPVAPRSKPPIGPNPYVAEAPGNFVQAGDRRLFVRRFPSSAAHPQPLVYIHGLGGSSQDGRELLSLLSDTVDAIAPDLPGFGKSPPPPPDKYRPRDHARAVADLVRLEFPDTPVHVIGHSLGGATAVQFAAANPELVRTLTLIAPALPSLVPRRTNFHYPVIAVPKVGEKLTKKFMESGTTESRVRMAADLGFANSARLGKQRLDEMIEEAKERDLMPHRDAALLASLRGLMSTFFDWSKARPWLLATSIKAPVLLIYASNDNLVSAKAAIRGTKAFADARVVIIRDAGHIVQTEHPDLVADAWRSLLPTHSAAPIVDPVEREHLRT